jgi:hypothetical protein
MRSYTVFAVLVLAGFAPLKAQDGRRSGPATNAYLVEYHFRDGNDAATANDRRFSLMVNGEHKAVLKVGNRVPTVTGSFEPVTANSLVNTQYSYLDVGVSIECLLTELDSRVELHSGIELSSLGENGPPPAPGIRNPTIKQSRIDLNTTLHVGRPTVVATVEDPANRHLLKLEITITAAN